MRAILYQQFGQDAVPQRFGPESAAQTRAQDAMKSSEKEKGDPPNQGDSIILEARRGAGQPCVWLLSIGAWCCVRLAPARCAGSAGELRSAPRTVVAAPCGALLRERGFPIWISFGGLLGVRGGVGRLRRRPGCFAT